jgi:SAM-dependent methyltransferase
VQEGQRVLEIGTGSGLSTALLAVLVGASGHVTTVDVDPEIVGRARPLFARMRLENVALLLGDGRIGFPRTRPTSGWSRGVGFRNSILPCPDARLQADPVTRPLHPR